MSFELMPFVPSSFLFLVVRPGAPSSVLAPVLRSCECSSRFGRTCATGGSSVDESGVRIEDAIRSELLWDPKLLQKEWQESGVGYITDIFYMHIHIYHIYILCI